MNSRCKVGDLAMVKGGPNHGALCYIRARYESALLVEPAWVCEALQGMLLASEFNPTMRSRPAGVLFAALDRYLMPMRGEPDADESVRDIIEEVSA